MLEYKIGERVDMQSLRMEHRDYKAMSWRWKKMRILMAGEDAVKTWDVQHTKGAPNIQTFILCPPGQEHEQYAFAIYDTRFLNLVARTASVLSGFLFYRDPVIKLGGAEMLLRNVDMAGTPIEEFAKNVAMEALTIGRGGILVDYPDVPEGAQYTQLELIEKDIRPFLKYYVAEQIYNWEFTVIDNVRVLTRVLIDETLDNMMDMDLFVEPTRSVIRELKLEYSPKLQQYVYRNTLFVEQHEEAQHNDIRKRGSGMRHPGMIESSVIPRLADGRPLDRLPFQFTGPQYDQVHIQKAPLSDVADLNIEHYRKCVAISSALFHCAHPTPIFCGFNFEKGKEVLLGSRQGITTPSEGAHASYLELNGQSITEIRKERDAVLAEAASMGARIGASASTKSVNETAEAARLKSSGETAILYTLTSALDQIFSRVLGIAAQWMLNTKEEPSVAFNREYMPFRLEGNDINALVSAVKDNLLSFEDFLDILKTGGIMKQSRTVTEYIAAIRESKKLKDELNPQPL